MFVKDCMTRHPILIDPDMAASEAQKIMAENNVRHLPVTGTGKKLEGLVTRSNFSLNADVLGSLNVWEISRRLSNVKVKEVMVDANLVVSTTTDTPVERAAQELNQHHIGCLPVVEDGIVVGIITESDLLNALQQMLGLREDGIRVTIRVPNRPGEFAKLATTVAEHHWGVMGIGTYPSRKFPNHYDVVLKIPKITVEEADRILKEIPDQEIIDIRSDV